MKLTCPGCGGIYSADAWKNDADVRQCIRLIAEMPGEISRRCLAYLAMFRPASGRGLAWSKALRLAGEISDMTKEPYLQWDGKPARPIDARIWGLAMERMSARPPKRLPLTSHGYLRALAYEIADESDKGREYAENVADRVAGTKMTGRTEGTARPADMERPDVAGLTDWLDKRRMKP